LPLKPIDDPVVHRHSVNWIITSDLSRAREYFRYTRDRQTTLLRKILPCNLW